MDTGNALAEIGRRLAAARLQRHLSQGTVARRSGLAPSYISRIENGKVHPTFRTVQRIADAIQVPLGELTGPVRGKGKKHGPCPITRTGDCLLDLVRSEVKPAASDGTFTPSEIRLLRRFARWVHRVPRDRQRAMEILLQELLDARGETESDPLQ